MNLFVADPHWYGWIVWYFFLGGIAAGAYFVATLIDLRGREEDRPLARVGYGITFPLVIIGGLLLILDLDQPTRFWHMLFKSERVHEAFEEGWPWTGRSWQWMAQAPLLKYWSPMSIGSWALLLFGFCSFLSFVGSLWPGGRLSYLLRRSLLGRALQLLGSAVGLFVAAYTGALLTATNQPFWSDTTWIASLFLTSAASTGIAAIILLARYRGMVSVQSWHRLERADLWALGLELAIFVGFLVSLGTLLVPVWGTWNGKLLIVGTLAFGLLVPLAVHFRPGVLGSQGIRLAAASALLGGFILRYAILMTPPELLAHSPAELAAYQRTHPASVGILSGFSPEDGRLPGGGPGADPGNKTADLQPRSKVFNDE